MVIYLTDEESCKRDVYDDSLVNSFSNHFSDKLEQVQVVVR